MKSAVMTAVAPFSARRKVRPKAQTRETIRLDPLIQRAPALETLGCKFLQRN